MTNPILVQVNGIWRRTKRIIEHPTGDRYQLAPRPGEPDTVAVAAVTRSIGLIKGEGLAPLAA